MTAHQYFSRLSQAYSFFVEGRDNLIETRAGHVLSRILSALKVPHDNTLDGERRALLEQAIALYAQAKKPTVRQGAAIADMISTIYGAYCGMRCQAFTRTRRTLSRAYPTTKSPCDSSPLISATQSAPEKCSTFSTKWVTKR